ncbi:uncharacterized protein [Palaemon carinicauda]|uniref:uncharacterized protein n=1 Tax=Palaemon carinicauda TaxID=392227 RepID=UPI0035B5ABCB
MTSAALTPSTPWSSSAVTESATTTENILDVTARGYIDVAALGKVFATDHKTTLSASYPKELAIDRDNTTKYISSSLTLSQPWWMVELKTVYDIKLIYILPYVDCGLFCLDAIHLKFYTGDSLVKDGNFASYINVAYYWGVYTSDQGYLIASVYTKARYVAIVLNGEIGFDVLALAEVMVFVEPIS